MVKKYGEFRAVDGISFVVPKGKIIGFLGPNGAGKTTTIQMLLGITLTNGGTIKYFGKDFATNRLECLQKINFTSAFNTLLGRVSVWENLLVFANLYQVQDAKKKIQELLGYFEISRLAGVLYKDLSAGQKTRVNLVKSLINDPDLLLMDEPTASLDPDIADKTLALIETLKRDRNLSILYTSHNMNEITRICDEVIFLDHGKIVAQDTPANLTKKISNATLQVTLDTGEVRKIDTEEEKIPELLFSIHSSGVRIIDIQIERPTLEDVFLQIARKK